MAETLKIRIHKDFEGDVDSIKEWCEANRSTINSVLNSFLPAIAYAVNNQVLLVNGKRYIRADFGDMLLREPHDYRNYRPNE